MALDNEGFSPGTIDGRIGPRMIQAMNVSPDVGRTTCLRMNAGWWQTWKVPADFSKDVAPLPEGWTARSKLKALTYETVREKVAERFHVSEDFLQFLNPTVRDWSRLRENDTLKVPALSPRRLPRADHLSVRLSDKVIVALDADNHPLASFPCSIAAKKEKRPVGKLEVRVLASDPEYLFDPKLFEESAEAKTIKSKLMIPPGPNNPVGAMWIGLDRPGYGIHGSPWPEDIGKTESHGCFRLSNWDAKRLAGMLKIGTPVWIEN